MVYRVYKIENYILRYDKNKELPWIIFQYKDGEQWHNVNWHPPKDNAVYIVDMLRNEQPCYWVPEGGYLTTGEEPVGEEES